MGSAPSYPPPPPPPPSHHPSHYPTNSPTPLPTFSPTIDPSIDDEIIVSIHGANFDDKGYGVVVDKDENIYTTGFISQNGVPSVFLRKSNNNLDELFLNVQSSNPQKTSIGYAITINDNYVYITGVYDSQILLMKYPSTSSTPIYLLNNFGSGTAYAITTDKTGTIYITGSLATNSIFMKKLSSDGNELFTKVSMEELHQIYFQEKITLIM